MNATVFHQAVADGDATQVRFLINIGQQARVNQPNKQGYTALQQSCKDGRIEVVHVLLNHGADINTMGRKDRTALHLAAAGGYSDIVKLLIKSCADLTVKDGEGNSPEDVAKSEEIANLLSAAHAVKKAKSPPTRKMSNSEEWSQNFKSLAAGSRNSMVSNSSSDSGVYTEEFTSSRIVDPRLSGPRNGGNRGLVGESRTMEVLNELEEVHGRSSVSVGQTIVKPQPKLRRSMSERLPSRRARRSSTGGQRNISEELSALNLILRVSSTKVTTESEKPQSYYDHENEPCKDINSNDPEYTSVDSPINDDLDQGLGLDICAEVVESGQGSTRKYPTYDTRSLPRNVSDTVVVCYAGGDEGCDDVDELDKGPFNRDLQRAPERDTGEKFLDDSDLYRRSQPRNLRSSRSRTVEVGQVSHENQKHPVESHAYTYQEYSDYNSIRRHGSFRGKQTIARELDVNANGIDISSRNYVPDNTKTITRKLSSCSETEMEQLYRSGQQNACQQFQHYQSANVYDRYNENKDHRDIQKIPSDICNNIPGYEETLSRLRRHNSFRARRPASRQVSQV